MKVDYVLEVGPAFILINNHKIREKNMKTFEEIFNSLPEEIKEDFGHRIKYRDFTDGAWDVIAEAFGFESIHNQFLDKMEEVIKVGREYMD